jgi:hypothetical membrane protein
MTQLPFHTNVGRSLRTHQTKQSAWLASLAVGGLLYFVLAVVSLHVLRSELNPLKRAVSNYAIGPFGLLMSSAFFTLALSEVALGLGLARSLAPSLRVCLSVLLLNLAGMGLVVIGIFPGDVTSLHPPATTTAVIHWTGAALSFLSLMIATFLLPRCYQRDVRWQSFHRLAFALAVIIILALGLFGILALVGWVGVGERLYIATCLAWLFLTAMRLRSLGTNSTEGTWFSSRSRCL